MAEQNYRERKGITVDGTGDSSIAGNLGIGTTSPTESLAVRGGIKIGEFNDTDGTGYAGTAAPSFRRPVCSSPWWHSTFGSIFHQAI